MRLAQFLFVFLFLVFSSISLAQGNANIVPVLSLLLEETDSPTTFDFQFPDGIIPGSKHIGGSIHDDDGITSVHGYSTDGSGYNETINGNGNINIITSGGLLQSGSTFSIDITDSNGNVTTKHFIVPE